MDYLSTMNAQYFRNSLQLYNNFAITNEISSIRLAKRLSFIYYLNGLLALIRDIPQTKFHFQSILVDSLQITAAKFIMNSK